jgi:hypothetical protein
MVVLRCSSSRSSIQYIILPNFATGQIIQVPMQPRIMLRQETQTLFPSNRCVFAMDTHEKGTIM